VAFAAVLASFILVCTPQVGWAVDRSDGLPNFGRVTDTLFRGAQPNSAGFSALHDMGVSIVVDLRNESDQIAAEQRQVEDLGMKFVSIPWRGRDYPSNFQVAQFLDLVRSNPDAKIFVHCKAGKDRTGVMVAAYRIAVERKTVSDAVEELHQYKYHAFTLPHLKRYVKTIPELLESEAVFSAYAPSAPAAVPVAAPAAIQVSAPSAAPTPSAAAPAATPAVLTPALAPAAL
jgi:protein tyrosine phosphatase (PTP) superfamily phosphohydrolase (DUF442 family)